MKAARWILVVMMVVGMTGAAYACDAVKTASAENASNCSAKMTSAEKAANCSAKTASAEKAANCSAKMASAEKAANCSAKLASAGKDCSSKAMAAKGDCTYCDFITELKANQARVTMSTLSTDNGVTVVFAAVGEKDLEVAQAVADKAYTLMSGPAHCSYTRAEMAKNSCGNCAEGMGAFADANVAIEKTESGAETTVTAKNKDQIAKLHTFFASLNPASEKAGE